VTYRSLALLLAICPLTCGAADQLLPTAEGTTWNYEMIQEKQDEGFDLTEPNDVQKFNVTYRLSGSEKIDNRDLRRLEIYRGDVLESVDLIAIAEDGITCPARTDARGAIMKLIPPQRMLSLPLQGGDSWTFDGVVGETKVKQSYKVAGEQDIDVPAGKFRAWRIHCDQTLPSPATVDRWFVPNTGFVKVETAVKGISGGALQKTSMTLKELPKVTTPPENKPTPPPEKFSAGLSNKPTGEFKTEFKSETPAIYARWHGHDLSDHVEIRVSFIAENVADVTADYQIDESTTTAPAPNSGGTFTLSKPEGGWAPGDYRVEFYVGDELTQTVKLKISK
jgi:hypothetical protein